MQIRFARRLSAALLWIGSLVGNRDVTAQTMSFDQILALPKGVASHRVTYGDDPHQFADLFLPLSAGPHAVIILIHGGCWRTQYNLDHIAPFAAALAKEGFAVWSLEYRRIGDPGGGWPGTFEDAALGADKLRAVATQYQLDLTHVIAMGHSAGGHLALWLATRSRLPKTAPGGGTVPITLRGVVSLAGLADLRAAHERQLCGTAVRELMGGTPTEQADRYRTASPADLLPIGTGQWLVNGSADRIVPEDYVRQYYGASRATGDPVTLTVFDGAGHFELISPGFSHFQDIVGVVRSALGSVTR